MKTEGSTSKKKGEAKRTPMSDAQGQFAKSKADRNNDGISSANPRVLSGEKDGDATFPLKRER